MSRRRRRHGVPVMLFLALIAAAAWLAANLGVLAGCVLLIGTAYYLGQLHGRRQAPGPIQPHQARPEEPAAAAALPAATLPLADHGQDEELTDERPARRASRTRLLADPLSGAHPLRRPS
jgi:hypothetical protein